MSRMMENTQSPNQAASENTGRTYGGMSQAERKAQRKRQFLEAGLELFGTQGYRATTVRAVCREAKLTDRYFYESCGSLETLVMAVYEECMTDLFKQILSAIQQEYAKCGDALAALEAGLDCFYGVLEDPRVARICMVELEGISPEVNQLYNRYIQSLSRILLELADIAFPDWDLAKAEKEVLGISLIGALRQSATHWLMSNYAAPREVMVAGSLKLYAGLIGLIQSS